MSVEVSAEERERRLVQASEEYLNGILTTEAFQEAERRYMPDYRAAADALVRTRRRTRRPRWLQWLYHLPDVG